MADETTYANATFASINGCKHWVDGKRVWCPPMCPRQDNPRPTTTRLRRKWRRAHREDQG